MLLMTIGEGETIKLTWLHEGEEVTRDYTIELAPPDFMSAKKYKNKEIGLTVKDMTYEVRTALRLPDDKAAVVVAKIEPGSPAEVARIEPFELIAAVDGQPVGSAQEFEERIKAALAAGRTKLRLTIEYLGKSRLADLDLAPPKEQLKPEAGEVETKEEE
jgi:S1-C subfamily serine protease